MKKIKIPTVLPGKINIDNDTKIRTINKVKNDAKDFNLTKVNVNVNNKTDFIDDKTYLNNKTKDLEVDDKNEDITKNITDAKNITEEKIKTKKTSIKTNPGKINNETSRNGMNSSTSLPYPTLTKSAKLLKTTE